MFWDIFSFVYIFPVFDVLVHICYNFYEFLPSSVKPQLKLIGTELSLIVHLSTPPTRPDQPTRPTQKVLIYLKFNTN